ncbi:MAG: hypothetical protein D6728_04025 [Cyanobacteria bacterium J055]|nr:MAG: hypothetical protein D6728_04025 [Cyanobacteria bacterium J055]
MPLPAPIRSFKARLRPLSQPDTWTSVLGLLLLMPLGWQIIDHLQQPPPEAKTPPPKPDADATAQLEPNAATSDNATAAELDNSDVLNQLLDKADKIESPLAAISGSTPQTTRVDVASTGAAGSQLDTDAILEKFAAGGSPTASPVVPANSEPPIRIYPTGSIAQTILQRNPISANPSNSGAPLPSALQAALEKSAEREAAQSDPLPQAPQNDLALVAPPPLPEPSTSALSVPQPIPLAPPLTPADSNLPAGVSVPTSEFPTSDFSTPEPSTPDSPTSYLPFPTSPLPTYSGEERAVPRESGNLPPGFTSVPTSTQQTKLYPYIPERVYSSPLPALPPAPMEANSNNSGFRPLPNPTLTPQSQNPAAIPQAGGNPSDLEATPFSVERSTGGGEINTFANP